MLDFSAPDVIKSLLYWLKCNYYLQVIAGELYRNLALAIGCITVTTLILLSSWLGCLQVVFCVLLTLTNVAGFMHFWGKSEKLAEWSITIRLHGYFYGLSFSRTYHWDSLIDQSDHQYWSLRWLPCSHSPRILSISRYLILDFRKWWF